MTGRLSIIFSCLLLLFSLSFFNADAQDQQKYKIDITVKGVEDSVAYLGFLFGDKKYSVDTAVVNKSGAVFEGDQKLTPGIYFYYSPSFYFEFVVDENEFSISTTSSALYDDMEINNSKSNEYFKDFRVLMMEHQKSVGELMNSLDSTSRKDDSVAVFDQVRELNEINKSNRLSLEEKVGDNYVSQILVMMRMSPEFRTEDSLSLEERRAKYVEFTKTYWDDIDFSSEGLLRTPIFESKLKEFVDRVVFQNPDSIIVAVDDLLNRSKDNEQLYRYIMRVMFQKYQNPKIMGMDKVFVHLSDEYYLKGKASWADEKMIKELQDEMKFHRENQIGMRAPQIHLVDTLDRPANLYAINSDYLILYFFSPTCGHCKKKTPVLKEVYKKLEGTAEVAAICVDTDIPKWKSFIKEFELDWLNYGDPHLRSNFRVQYNVRTTPVIYVLDKNKKIIGKKLDVDQLEGFINDQIKIAELAKS